MSIGCIPSFPTISFTSNLFFNRSEISIDDYNREDDGGEDDGGFDFGD